MKLIEKKPIVMILVGVVGIAMSSIFVRYSQAPSAVTAAWRMLWTVALMTPAVLLKGSVRRELWEMPPRLWGVTVASGLFLAAHFVLWFESLRHTSVASSTTIVCTEVVWVALGFCLFLKGKLSGKAVAAILVAVLGSILIAWADFEGGGLYGDLLALGGAIATAAYTLLGRTARKTLSTTVYTYVVYATCTLVLAATCLVQGQSLVAYGISAPIVGLLLAVFSTILGHSIFSWCLKYFSPAFVSASKLCEPVVAGVMAGFLFGELPGMLQILGSILILTGVLYYSTLEGKVKKR